ncbi:hypothetical protein [Salinicola avicenniae]|uniref:hypothetical protein n=1 Tax=Salinicola avicenniae TaxID=2916836 RepID=UPI00207331DB|nr:MULTISPECIES: hypothetical protein [unclassified Salinicola]
MDKEESVDLILDYVSNMGRHWEGNSRQEKKSINRLKAIKDRYGWENEALLSILSKIAEERIKCARKTVFLSSFGASGSHLIQHIISLTSPSIALGEVYIAPETERALGKLSPKQKNKFMEMYHLINSTSPENIFSKAIIINTAHKAKLQTFSDCTENFSSAFIVRNPVDLVMSRTFRKDEYREYLGKKDISDRDYLQENIKKTTKFYNAAFSYEYDEYLIFEDLFSNPHSLSDAIFNLLGGGVSRSVLSCNVETAISDGHATNKYHGAAKEIPDELYEFARESFSDLFEKISEKTGRKYC